MSHEELPTIDLTLNEIQNRRQNPTIQRKIEEAVSIINGQYQTHFRGDGSIYPSNMMQTNGITWITDRGTVTLDQLKSEMELIMSSKATTAPLFSDEFKQKYGGYVKKLLLFTLQDSK